MTEDEIPSFVWAEWEKWSSCKPVWVRQGEIAAHLVLKSRICYRWKPAQEGLRAKARIVIAGLRDPHLTLLTRESPVLAKTSFHLILQWASSHHVLLWNGDCSSAFLQGEPDSERPESIFMKPPSDPIAVQAVPQWGDKLLLYKLSAPVYGQANAPRQWFEHVRRVLLELGWVHHSLDPCLFMQRVNGRVVALLGIHVDDIISCALKDHEKYLHNVEGSFTWGSPWTSGEFTFIGRKVTPQPDWSIIIDVSEMASVAKVNYDDDTLLSEHPELVTEFRSGVGSLQWLASTTRGDIAADTSLIQKPPKDLKVSNLKEVAAVLRYVKATKESYIKIVPIPLDELMFVAFGDSGFANAPSNKSQEGFVVAATDKRAKQETRPASLLEWKSYRHQRVLRSTLAAEVAALDRAHDHANFMAIVFSEMTNGRFIATMNERPEYEGIITKGNVGACRYLLEQEGLLQFFRAGLWNAWPVLRRVGL